MKRSHSRRRIVVDPRVQARIVVGTSLPMFACLVLALAGEIAYDRAIASGWLRTDGTIFGMPEARLGMLLLFVSAATTQLVVSLLASQKVAGVAYHIHRILGEFRHGNRSARVRLRRGDYQQELGHEVNAFLDWTDGALSGAASAGAARATARSPGAGSRPATEAARSR